MPALVRPFTATDMEEILRLERTIAEAPHWSRAIYESFLDSDPPARHLLVAETSDAIAGFIAGRVVADACELESIAVSLSARRDGVGSGLLTGFLGWARACGAARVELEVRAGNSAAIGFYRHAGFHPAGRRPSYYQNPEEDALLLTLLLKPLPEA